MLRRQSEVEQADASRQREALRGVRKGARLLSDQIAPHPAVVAVFSWLRKNPPKSQGDRRWSHRMLQCAAESEERGLLLLHRMANLIEANGGSLSQEEGELRASLAGTTFHVRVSERINQVEHVPTAAEVRARDRYWRSPYTAAPSPPNIPQYDYLPTGILTMTCGARNWNDTKITALEDRFGQIIAESIEYAERKKADEDARAARERRYADRVRAYEEATTRRESEHAQYVELRRQTRSWVLARQIREYVDAVEASLAVRGAPSRQDLEWLDWARSKADWVDPLINVSDVILDAPEPAKPGYCWSWDDDE